MKYWDHHLFVCETHWPAGETETILQRISDLLHLAHLLKSRWNEGDNLKEEFKPETLGYYRDLTVFPSVTFFLQKEKGHNTDLACCNENSGL